MHIPFSHINIIKNKLKSKNMKGKRRRRKKSHLKPSQRNKIDRQKICKQKTFNVIIVKEMKTETKGFRITAIQDPSPGTNEGIRT